MDLLLVRWLSGPGTGLQSRTHRFDSGPDLHHDEARPQAGGEDHRWTFTSSAPSEPVWADAQGRCDPAGDLAEVVARLALRFPAPSRPSQREPGSKQPSRRRRRRGPRWREKSRMVRQSDGRCAYCGGLPETTDHVVPRSRGGSDAWSNLVACCVQCNRVKADRLPREAGMVLRVPLRFMRSPEARP